MIPTIEQVMKYYRVIAQTERMKTGRPGEDTVENVLRGTKAVCRAAGIELTENVVVLTRQNIDVALASFMGHGLTRLTAWSYVSQLRGLFGKWCRPYCPPFVPNRRVTSAPRRRCLRGSRHGINGKSVNIGLPRR